MFNLKSLIDTITEGHSVLLLESQITCAHGSLSLYLEKYKSRLRGKNIIYIRHILAFLNALKEYFKLHVQALQGKALDSPPLSRQNTQQHNLSAAPLPPCPKEAQQIPKKNYQLITANTFLNALNMDHVNVFKIVKYLQESKLGLKVSSGFIYFGFTGVVCQSFTVVVLYLYVYCQLNGFVDKIGVNKERSQKPVAKNGKSEGGSTLSNIDSLTSTLLPSNRRGLSSMQVIFSNISAFLLALANADKNGRIIVGTDTNKESEDSNPGTRGAPEPTLQHKSQFYVKYLLLHPADFFREIVDESRAVILAGGTLEPVSCLCLAMITISNEAFV